MLESYEEIVYFHVRLFHENLNNQVECSRMKKKSDC